MCSWFGEGGLAEGVFAALGRVANKSGTDEEIAFFFFLSTTLELFAYKLLGSGWTVSGVGFPSWKARGSAATPFLLEDLTLGVRN